MNIFCIEFGTPVTTESYEKFKNILTYKPIIEHGKCKNLSDEEKEKNSLFFKYVNNLDNCYYIKYKDQYHNSSDNNKMHIFDDQIYINREKNLIQYRKMFEITPSNELINFIQKYCEPLHKFNMDHNRYSEKYQIVFFYKLLSYINFSNILSSDFLSNIQEMSKKDHQIILLEFMIYNLYNYNFDKKIKIPLINYSDQIQKKYEESFDQLIKHANQIVSLSMNIRILNDKTIKFQPLKFKPSTEHKIINYLRT